MGQVQPHVKPGGENTALPAPLDLRNWSKKIYNPPFTLCPKCFQKGAQLQATFKGLETCHLLLQSWWKLVTWFMFITGAQSNTIRTQTWNSGHWSTLTFPRLLLYLRECLGWEEKRPWHRDNANTLAPDPDSELQCESRPGPSSSELSATVATRGPPGGWYVVCLLLTVALKAVMS